MKPLDSRIQIFFALLTIELLLLPLKPHKNEGLIEDPIESEKATALPLYGHVLSFFRVLANGIATKAPVVLSSSLYHLTTARFCTVAYSHDTFTKVSMYAILSFSCELILLDQFYIGFKSFSLGIFVYAIDLLWESKFPMSVLMFSIVLNLNPTFLLVLPLILYYVVQNYIFTFGLKPSVFKDKSASRIFRLGPFARAVLTFALPFLSVFFTPNGCEKYVSVMQKEYFSSIFSVFAFVFSSFAPLVIQFWRGPLTKIKLAICCSQSFLLYSVLQIAHTTIFAANDNYPRTLEMPLTACYIMLSLTAGFSVQHGKVAFLLGVLSHSAIFLRVPLSLELFLCWTFISNYTLVTSFLLLQLRNMRFRVPKVVNSWRGLGVSLNKKETGYVVGLVVIEIIRNTKMLSRYLPTLIHIYHIIGFVYTVWPTITLLNYSA